MISVTIEDICTQVIQRKLCRSRTAFCTDWLGMNRSYLAQMHDKQVGGWTILKLQERLCALKQYDLAARLDAAVSHELDMHRFADDGNPNHF